MNICIGFDESFTCNSGNMKRSPRCLTQFEVWIPILRTSASSTTNTGMISRSLKSYSRHISFVSSTLSSRGRLSRRHRWNCLLRISSHCKCSLNPRSSQSRPQGHAAASHGSGCTCMWTHHWHCLPVLLSRPLRRHLSPLVAPPFHAALCVLRWLTAAPSQATHFPAAIQFLPPIRISSCILSRKCKRLPHMCPYSLEAT